MTHMAKTIVLDVGPTGKTSGLHDDDFPLSFLGSMRVERASEIVFNEDTQLWDVKLPGQGAPFLESTRFSSYNDARDFEVLWLTSCRIARIDPYTGQGQTIAGRSRTRLGHGK